MTLSDCFPNQTRAYTIRLVVSILKEWHDLHAEHEQMPWEHEKVNIFLGAHCPQKISLTKAIERVFNLTNIWHTSIRLWIIEYARTGTVRDPEDRNTDPYYYDSTRQLGPEQMLESWLL